MRACCCGKLVELALCASFAATTVVAQQQCADAIAEQIGTCAEGTYEEGTRFCEADPCTPAEIGEEGTTCCTGCSFIDFTAEASVENDGCRLCDGPDTEDCNEAVCAAGYHGYSALTRTCQQCTPQVGCETHMAGVCSATATNRLPCTLASDGYYLANTDVATDCSTIDFTSEGSVVDNGCLACTDGATTACSMATCATGYHTYVPSAANGGSCSPCEPQIGCQTSTAGQCSGQATTHQPCTVAADGFYLDGDVALSCSTVDFSGIASVSNGGCTSCIGGAVSDCTMATCATGYHTYDAATQVSTTVT